MDWQHKYLITYATYKEIELFPKQSQAASASIYLEKVTL